MPDLSTLAIVAAASLALTLMPGPSVLYIVARGVEGGRRTGLASAFGVALGGLVHVAFAAVGLSALLASSATAFSAVKWAGIVYLAWLGLSRLLPPRGEEEHDAKTFAGEKNLRSVFWQGALVDILNPKVVLFFLAFLPQFVAPSQGPVWAQMIVFGLTFTLVGLLTDGLYALLSGTASEWLRSKNEGRRFRRGQRYISGAIYLLLAAASTATDSGKH